MIYAGYNGKVWGFFLENNNLDPFFKLTEKEHMSLINEQSKGKVIVFHKDKKPTLEEFNPTKEEKSQKEISELEFYLQKTDWYAIRFAAIFSFNECTTKSPIPKSITSITANNEFTKKYANC